MTDLRFERIAQIIAIAAVGSSDKGISKYFVQESAVQIRFSEYVKSQVHLNIVCGLYQRSLREYVEALWFLNGKTSCEATALKVLRYFYSDLSNFLINNQKNVKLMVVVDTDFFDLEKRCYVIEELGKELLSDFNEILSGELKVDNWRYSTILDYVKDADDLRTKAESYAFAEVLRQCSNSEELKIVESR